MGERHRLTRVQRSLVGVVVAGALVIAGIGFAGSYAAVRELALKKGFGNFAYVFPIGIDAGICVLLALDLVLTWIRIPFPLLRQTAWLLTVATIAFNGAAAWPDPLGVGMHAVIPVLFVVSVEAARHAIGRIADITADKHMEGVRLTRWMLSPLPTFLLWRRMKLWELRSYEQVIKLEQDRLVYQARLHSRFGRAWRRKAPVESLMPLRLARYGVPLAETAPSGLAAAGIKPALLPPAPQLEVARAPAPAAPALPEHRELEPSRAAGGPLSDEQLQPLLRVLQHRYAPPADPAIAPDGVLEEEPSWEEFFYSAWLAYAGEHDQYPDAAALAAYVFQRDGITGATGQPLMGEDLEDFVAAFQEREFGDAEPPVEEAVAGFGEQLPPVPSPSVSDPQAEPVGAGAHAAEEKRGPKVNAAIDGLAGEQIPPQPPAEKSGLTTVDRYYLAWVEYQQQRGAEPNGVDLSKYLGEKGVVGRNGRPAAASTLRRYLLPFRIYSVWAEHRGRSEQPSLKTVAEACAARGITLQYNEPITAATIAEHTADFERRWHAVIRHRTDVAAQSR
ncbi:DUF2637 domain-containing protein [Streptomyces mirabilis]|uniref:DUF2637 domain-containing protein n=1 Tax=Streptomyces mirabilis TaxID=68239 RepID=UPI00201E69C1|nr:DUF2637 domain-containing protein [Streptomyces mirabilis]